MRLVSNLAHNQAYVGSNPSPAIMIIAKNLLLGNTCDNCLFKYRELDDLNCKSVITSTTNGKYMATASYPEENTCEHWTYAPEFKLNGYF